jgi:hypothetical protein
MWRFAHRSPACSASVALTFRHVTVSTCGFASLSTRRIRTSALNGSSTGDLRPESGFYVSEPYMAENGWAVALCQDCAA